MSQEPNEPRGLFQGVAASTTVLVFGIALVVLSVLLPAVDAIRDRESAVESARQRGEALARLTEDSVTRALNGADLTMHIAADAVRGARLARGARLDTALQEATRRSTLLRSLSLVTPEGRVVASSAPGNVGRDWPVPAGIADKLVPEATLIGPPAAGRDIGTPPAPGASLFHVPAVRMAADADGAHFLLVAALNPEHFSAQFQLALAEDGGGISLATREGVLLASSGAVALAPGTRAAARTPLFADWLPQKEHATLEGTGLAGGEAFLAYRSSRAWPVVVVVEFDKARALGGWFAYARAVMLFGFGLAAVVGVLVWTAVTGLRERERRAARLAGEQGKLLESGARSRAVQDTAIDPILVLDGGGHVLDWNAAAERTFGYKREQALGKVVGALIIPPFARDDQRVYMNPFLTLPQGFGLDRHLEIVGRRADGTEIPLEVAITRVATDAAMIYTAFLQDISMRKRAEEALRESERKYRRVVESIREGIFQTNTAGELTFVNSAFAAIAGLPLERIVGTRLSMFVDEADREAIEQMIRRLPVLLETGELPPPVDARMSGPAGEPRLVRLTARPVIDAHGEQVGIAGTLDDVTEARLAQQGLADQLRFTRELIDAIPTPIFVKNVDGEYLSVNRAWEEFMGLSRAQVIGRTAFDLAPPEVAERYLGQERQVMQTGASVTVEDTVLNAAKQTRHTLLTKCAYRKDDGTVAGIIGTFVDMTAARIAQKQILESKEAAERANEAKSTFLANMSHEIRTPMNGIIGMTRLALEGPLERDQRQYLELVQTSADSLLGIINDILDLSKIEADRLSLESVEYAPREVVGEVARLQAMRAQQKGLEFVVDVGADVPARLLGDPMRLKQVLVNLLGNAIKFTSAGYVAISIEREAGPQPRLRVAVSDSGIGIPEARQREVFEAFSQADESITRRYGGTGLGLAISSRLVALMGGALEIKSSVGVGSCFSFTIPIRGESAAAPARSPAFDGKRVLVLEPNELTRTQLRHLVEYLGATCECAADADEALRLLEGAAMQEKPFSLLLAEAGAAGAEPGRLLRGFATPPRLIVMRPMDTRGAPPGDGSVGLVRKPVLDENLVEEAERLSGLREARGPSRAEQLAPLAPDLAVLVAEDHPVNQLLIRRLLEKAGCRVTVANDGREALELVKARPFDVVLMDLQMPEMGGLESTRKIREYQGPLGLATPIVALTAHAHESDRAICLDAGMNDYLAKPVNPPELYRVLSRFARSGPRPEPEIPAMAPTPSAAPAAADPPPGTAKPHFERAAFEESIGNDPPLFRKLLDLFFEIQPARMDDLAAQLAKGDADAGKRTAHTLVGSFRTMMMPVAGDLAHEIEARLKEGKLDEACESFGRLKPEFAALVGELEAIRAVLPEAEAS